MGIHDYVDFVQRNGQTLTPLRLTDENVKDDDDCGDAVLDDDRDDDCDGPVGSSEATLVRVPGTYSVRDILQWPLPKFAEFPFVKATYSWDGWGFAEVKGYSKVLQGYDDWWDAAIWVSKSFPGERLVNFEPAVYAAFVLGHADLERVPWAYYRTVFENRFAPLPKTKGLALFAVTHAARENLWDYDKRELEPLPLPAAFTDLRAAVLEEELYARPEYFEYRLVPSADATAAAAAMSKIRLETLAGDHVEIPPDPTWAEGADPAGILGTHLRRLDGGKLALKFCPECRVRPRDELVRGCIECGAMREIGRYTCAEHPATLEMHYNAVKRLAEDAESLMPNLRALAKFAAAGPPPAVESTFEEKGVRYTLRFARV